MEKIWKLYNDKSNTFFNQSFEGNKDLINFQGFDFFIDEIKALEIDEVFITFKRLIKKGI